MERPNGVTFFGIFEILLPILGNLIMIFLLFSLLINNQKDYFIWITIIYLFIGIFIGFSRIVIGIGLLMLKKWAYVFVKIIAIINLILTPISVIVQIVGGIEIFSIQHLISLIGPVILIIYSIILLNYFKKEKVRTVFYGV
tara:strand:+ start:170 stop:592 length:423 start_codon:yes stop_codon:yes gene_type:complete